MVTEQTYEEYWKLTVEYTDIHGERFNGTLRLIVDFIDARKDREYTPALFSELQERVNRVYPKADLGSVRKSINQFVKLGFVNAHLASYHPDTREFLEAKTNRKRNTLFSKIVYSNAKFNASVTECHDWNQINFLLKTLAETGKLSKDELIALMLVDIGQEKKGYLTAEELKSYVTRAAAIGFIERKYNQISYLTNFLKKLDDIVFVHDELYFEEDAKRIFGNDSKEERKRDPYLHRLYKNQLQEESVAVFGDTRCMVERIAYPVLIASHIKPFCRCNEQEAYDAENGILLSRNIDSLFDLGYLTFDNDGTPVPAETLNEELKRKLADYRLGEEFLTEKRRAYLVYHRNEIFGKKFKS